MANVNQEIDTIRVGGVDYEVSDPHALYGEHDESAPDLTDNPLYESDLVAQIVNDSTKPSAANVPYQLKQEIDQISSDLASKTPTIYSKQISGETIDGTWGGLYKKEFDITVDKDWRNKDVFVSFVPLASAPTTLWCAITAMTSTKISVMLIRPTSTSQVAGKIFVHCYEAS